MAQAADQGLAKFDQILKSVDGRLADALDQASQAADDRARQLELKKTKAIVAEFIGCLAREPLVRLADSNPFGVKTDLKASLADALRKAANAIG